MKRRIMKPLQQWLVTIFTCSLALHAPAEEKSGQVPTDNERRLLSNIRQMIFAGRRSGEGYFSADGKQMIFQSEREPDNPFYQIYHMDLGTGDTRRVSPGMGKTTCAWIHPAGDRVLFASTHADPQALAKQREELDKRAKGQGSRYSWSFDEQYDIYETALDGSRLRNLTRSPGYDAEGSWSPDGRLIAFASNRQAYTGELSAEDRKRIANDPSYFMDLYLMDADGGNLRRLTTTPGYDGGPFFNAQGTRITWRRFSPDGSRAEIWTMNIDGTDKRQLTRLGAMSWAPYFHPSGDYIIFTTNLHGYGNFELYLVDSAGRAAPVRVTETKGFDGLPVFTPDGQRLAWTSKRSVSGRPQIFLADWNHGAARKLLGLSDQTDSAISPDARPILGGVPDLNAMSPAITTADLRRHLAYLASDALGGRLTGTPGERLASEYVAGVFTGLGLQPAGDMGDWFQTFEFTQGVSLEAGNRLTLNGADGKRPLDVDREWRPLSFSQTGATGTARIAFAGYGILAPSGEGFPPYDSYGDLDVKDKWVLVFRYLPEDITPEHRQHLNEFAGLRYKAMVARDKGARGLIIASGPNARVQDQLVKLRTDGTSAGTSIAVISVSDELAQRLIQPTGKDLRPLQTALDRGEPQAGFDLPQIELDADIRLRQERLTGRNVVARLNAGKVPGESVVIIGAHLDHIGTGVEHDSRASGNDRGRIHPGADDNASGVAALLEIAQYLMERQRQGKLSLKRDILFAAWSGEELGRLGSSHFVDVYQGKGGIEQGLTPPVAAYLNMDMVGRLDRHLFLQGTGSSPVWSGEIERRNAPVGLSVQTRQDSYLPTDAMSFYLQGVPILSAFTGTHSDYNTPRDTADRINYEGTAKIAQLMALLTRSLAMRDQPPEYRETEKPISKASRANLRAYLGTIPEYAESDLKGVQLNGVAKGGPAEKAGLRRGDLIVGVAGRTIENIYDYTYALNALKVDQPVKILVERDGQPAGFLVTPASRE